MDSESVTRIELVPPAWQVGVLPLNYTDDVCFVGVVGVEPTASSVSVMRAHQLHLTPVNCVGAEGFEPPTR